MPVARCYGSIECLNLLTFFSGCSLEDHTNYGIDIPSLNIDVKATSAKQPQSSAPFMSAEQKIFGLGYNLAVFVYTKTDVPERAASMFSMSRHQFYTSEETADKSLTQKLRAMKLAEDDVQAVATYLVKRGLPGSQEEINLLARKVLENHIPMGKITISNALQWRLQFGKL